MARVWEMSRQSGSHLLMLLAIADFSDDDGNAYPAVQTLAQKCRMKPRNANVILAALRASGELDVRQNEGPRGTNLYRVVLDGQPLQGITGVQRNAGLQRSAPSPAKACSKPLQGLADEPSVNHHEPSTIVDSKAVLACPVKEIVDLYHAHMPLNPRVKVLNQTRRSAISARWREASAMTCAPFVSGYSTKEEGLTAWRNFFEICADSLFLTGRAAATPGRPPFIATIDFLVSPSGFVKCLENKYHREFS